MPSDIVVVDWDCAMVRPVKSLDTTGATTSDHNSSSCGASIGLTRDLRATEAASLSSSLSQPEVPGGARAVSGRSWVGRATSEIRFSAPSAAGRLPGTVCRHLTRSNSLEVSEVTPSASLSQVRKVRTPAKRTAAATPIQRLRDFLKVGLFFFWSEDSTWPDPINRFASLKGRP